jgi:hypothetical protein
MAQNNCWGVGLGGAAGGVFVTKICIPLSNFYFCFSQRMPPAIYYLVKNYGYSIKGLLGFVVCKSYLVPPFTGHPAPGA